MNYSIKPNKIIFSILLIVFSVCLLDCNNSKFVSFEVKKITLECDTNLEEGRVLFNLKITNNNTQPIKLDDSANQGLLQAGIFLLLSDQLYTGSIRLKMGVGYEGSHKGIAINKGEVKDVWVSVNHSTLAHILRTNNAKNATFLDVKNFLNYSNYSIVYISFKGSTNRLFSKSYKIECSCKI